MTHAALQDLVKKWQDRAERIAERSSTMLRDDAYSADGKSAGIAECADELSAAISAMEGEAVPAVWMHKGDLDTLKAFPDAVLFAIGRDLGGQHVPLYTAPPPQQADQDTDMMAECMIECREGLIATGIIEASVPPMFVAEAVIAKFRSLTHPTPSPGPHGGGDGGKVRKAMRAACDAMAALATPPQPEAQVSGLSAVLAELERATRKFPTWPTDPLHAVGVVNEEVGELNKALLQAVYEPHKSGPEEVREEAIQAAAMALRFVMSLDAYEYRKGEQHSQAALTTSGRDGE